MNDDPLTLRRDLELTREFASDQNEMVAKLQESLDLYREALTAVMRNIPTENLDDHVPDGASFCLQRRNGKIVPVLFRRTEYPKYE